MPTPQSDSQTREWLNSGPDVKVQTAQPEGEDSIRRWLNTPDSTFGKSQDQTNATPPSEYDIASTLARQQPPPPKDAPQTENALSTMGKVLSPVSSALTGLRATFEKKSDLTDAELTTLGRREGVSFDVETGAPFATRTMANLGLNREQVRATYKDLPNVQDVTFNRMGEPVLTVKDPQTGQVKDVLANPVGIESGDFAFLAANLPEMIAGGLAAKGIQIEQKTLGAVSKVARAFLGGDGVIVPAARGAIGAETAGLAKDAVKDATTGMSEPFGNVAKNRAVAATADFLFGATLGTMAKAGARILTPLQARGPLQVDAEAARQLWRDKAGINIDLTPGEATGNPFLLRTEAFMAQKPGSSGVMGQMMEERRNAISEAQGILLGVNKSAIPPADAVGEDVMNALKSHIAPLNSIVDQKTASVLDAANTEIKNNVSNLTKVPSPIATPAVGKQLFDAAQTKLEAFRTASKTLYDKVNSNPLIAGQGRNIDATPLAKEAQGILDSVAAVEKEVQKPTGLLDASGRPLSSATTEKQPFTTFVESSALSRLKQLASAEDGKVSLRDLIELRRDINDDLSRGSAIGGLPERRLGDIRDALTNRIKTGLDELDNTGALRKDWEAANKHYSDNISQFKDADIVNIFKDDQQRGALGLNEVVNRALKDPDRWESYRNFFGSGSKEMDMLRRSFADRVVGRVEGSDTVDASAFLGRLKGAYENQPTIFNDVFGNNYQQLRTLGETMEQASKGDVNVADLAKSLSNGTLTKQKLMDLQRAQNLKDFAFQNKILRDIADGKAITDKPSQIVDHIVFKSEPENVTDIVAHLSGTPDVLDEVRQRALLKIFEESTAGVTGKETLTSAGLDKFLKDSVMVQRLTPVLGPETMDLLKATRDVLAPGSAKENAFIGAGRLSAGSAIAQIERHLGEPGSMYEEVSHILKSFIVASMYKTGPVRAYISNNAFGPKGTIVDKDAVIQGLMIASPVIEDLTKIFGEEASRVAAVQIKTAIDGNIKQRQQKK